MTFMSKIGAFVSGVGGVLVLAGYFVPSLNAAYYLIPVGGVLAIISAVLMGSSRPIYPPRY